MKITPYKLRILVPPKDNLKSAIIVAKPRLKDGDVVIISSKVVSIGEGRTILCSVVGKDKLIEQEADWYLKAPRASRYRRVFTIAGGTMVGSAGVDESNGNGYYILYPQDPMKSARALRAWLQKTYGLKNLGVIISDSTSIPLRRGALGFALAWSGFKPLRDYRGTEDLFNRTFNIEVANIADALAAAGNLAMGEGAEQTPLVVIRDVPNLHFTNSDTERKGEALRIAPDDDIFAPLFFNEGWKSRKNKS